MVTWDQVLNSLVQRSFAAAHRGDRAAEAEALRQFDLLVKLGGSTDLTSSHEPAMRDVRGKGKA